MRKEDVKFIPTTMDREIAPKIFFRAIKSWSSNTFAGEGDLFTTKNCNP